MTIKNVYPSQRPDIIYNVINGREELPVNAEFTRATIATYVDANGVIQTAGAGVPRFNHNPETLELEGLLIEFAATNAVYPSELASASYSDAVQRQGAIWYERAQLVGGKDDPAGGTGAVEVDMDTYKGGRLYWYKTPNTGPIVNSFYMKAIGTGAQIRVYQQDNNDWTNSVTEYDWDTGNVAYPVPDSPGNLTIKDVGNGWRRLHVYNNSNNPSATSAYTQIAFRAGTVQFWGFQMENSPYFAAPPTTLIPTTTEAVSRNADEFALTSPRNFDPGFSLLLDSETTTEDFLYKIKNDEEDDSEDDGKKVIAYLKNDGGTLEWDVNGTSAQSLGDYPQVGFKLGRVRTISSFTAAGDNVKPNYLYTTGLSFPTISEAGPGAGANKITFGVPQTLKALYIWPGQLPSSEAVALIKGNDNVIKDNEFEPGSDNFVFVFNTDPENTGVRKITLEGIEPTAVSAGMTIDWGDGSEKEPYNQGVTPVHEYPYPGQYRIQINAPSGFNSVRLGSNIRDSITRVDQWAPQHRPGSSTGGFTGDEMAYLLANQRTYNSTIPVFAYNNLTDMSAAFRLMNDLDGGNWDWVPVNLQSCKSLSNTFSWPGTYNPANVNQRDKFPQLKTSSALTNCENCFTNSLFTGFFDTDTKTTVYKPFTDTSQVVYWSTCFYGYRGTQLFVDLSAGKDFRYTFQYCTEWIQFQPGVLNQNCMDKALTVEGCWDNNLKLQSFPAMKFPVCTDFQRAWKNCESLESFSLIDTKKGINFESAWQGCTSLKKFPEINTSSGDIFKNAWKDCSGLEEFPKIVTDAGTNFSGIFMGCTGLDIIPPIDTPNGTDFTNFCAKTTITDFPPLDFSSGTRFLDAWYYCTNLANFPPNMFNTTGALIPNAFRQAWLFAALSEKSIENILVSLVTNGATKIELSMAGGTNADYKDWTQAGKDAYEVLAAPLGTAIDNTTYPSGLGLTGRAWDIDIRDTTDAAPYAMSETSGFYVNHQDGVVAFGELTPGSRHASGKANQETFTDEAKAVARVLELDKDFFPVWDRENFYLPGDRVKFGNCIYRALQENDARSFELPNEFDLDQEIPTPMNRQARWAEVYSPEALEEEPVAAFTVDEQPRKRARNADGTYRANNPNTPENEAWE